MMALLDWAGGSGTFSSVVASEWVDVGLHESGTIKGTYTGFQGIPPYL